MNKLTPWIIPALFIALGFYLPIGRVVIQGIGLSSNPAIPFTIFQALLSTLLAVVLALPIATLLYRRKFLGSKVLQGIIAVPFLMPTIVVAISLDDYQRFFRDSFDPFTAGLIGILVAHVFLNMGLIIRSVGSRIASLDEEQIEAAKLDGADGLRLWREIIFPQLRSTIAASSVLVFLYSATSFGIIRLLGGGSIDTIETEIFVEALRNLDVQEASRLAFVQTVITIAAFAVSIRLGNISIDSDSGMVRKLQVSDIPLLVFAGLVVGALYLVPVSSIFIKAFTVDGTFGFQNFLNLSGTGTRDLLNISVLEAGGNSLRNMLIASLLSMLIAIIVARASKDQQWLALPFLIPLGVSAVVIGLGYLVGFAGIPGLSELRASWIIVPLSQVVIALPLAIRLLQSAFGSIPRELTESAELDGAGDSQRLRLIELPLIAPAWRNVLAFVALISLGEFSAASFLATGDQATITTLLFRLASRPGGENFGMAMATSALIILISLLVLGFANTRRKSDSTAD
ncbi:MAG: ABC transporter permease subunit [Microbacteriaceae bacterium]|nr:ABC transporter permease subunit [Microbacteriaceae bacterium]